MLPSENRHRFRLLPLMVMAFLMSAVEGARILAIFPSPARSHQIVFRAFVEALVERGHELTVMTPDPIPLQAVNGSIQQIDWSYVYKVVESECDVAKVSQEGWNTLKVTQQVLLVTEMFIKAELGHPEVQRMIKDRRDQFDAVIVEYYQMTPFYAFAEFYGAPLIGITSIESISVAHRAVGNIDNPVAHPEYHHKFTRNLRFVQRLEAFITRLVLDYFILPKEFEKYDKIIESHFGSNMSKSSQLMGRIDFLLTNADPSLGFIRPTVPQSIQLGFLHVKPPKPLPEDLRLYLDNSHRGVIYFSLGTLIRTDTVSQRNVQLFVDAFKTLHYDVLWKWDNGIDLDGSSNIRTVPWVPQQDLLAHPNVKLFVTQGGQQSMEEAVDRQVPMVVIPFNFDQFGNGDKVVERGIGKTIWMEHLTTENLREAILEVIGNKKYKRNIERLAKLVRDQPMRPLDKAVWWTEYVIRHQGASHLRYKQAQMPAWQYHYYDVVATLLATALVVLALVAYVLKRLLSYLLLRAQSWQVRRVKQKAL
ncbi:UDP-glucosyltransferase 2-like isoform X1 [Ochlerotatus camptorhynchus]|uniref:UDP-glucosyltransferase 2-like isoform X1 n=1 Tax=Ochlerotatus camptorhynchus TaxID=644619 RepID=UPI0031E0BC59